MDDIRENNTPDTSEQTTGLYGQQGQYGQTPGTQPETFPPTAAPKKKISKAAIITVIVLVVIFAIALISLGPSYMQARKYGKAIVSGKNLDDAVEMAFPEKLIKDDEVYDLCQKAIQESSREIKAKGSTSFLGVKCGKSIKSNDCKKIEKYYNFLCTMSGVDKKVKIQKGYEYKIKFKAGGTKYYMECVLIKMKGEGWKVFPASLDDVDEFSSYLK